MEDTNQVTIRTYKETDAPFLTAIYFNTIHRINSRDYSTPQINAWAPESSLEIESWLKKWEDLPPLVALLDHQIVGFAEFEGNGHIDCFYCHHNYQGCGIGTALMKAIESQAQENQILKIYAEVSITARTFFEAKGFIVSKEQSVTIGGVKLTHYLMEKILLKWP